MSRRPRPNVAVTAKMSPALAETLYDIASRDFGGNVSEAIREAVKHLILRFDQYFGLGVCVNNVCTFVEPRFAEFLGYTVEDFRGLATEDIIRLVVAPSFRPMCLERLKRRMRREKVPESYTLDLLCKDGTIKTCHIRSRMFFLNGNHFQILIFCRATGLDLRGLEHVEEKKSSERQERVIAVS